jgi:Delta7-sterol 5-desaturase
MMVLRVDPELVRPARRPVPSAETHSILERRLERLIQRPRWARGRRLQPAEPGRERLAWDITYSLSTVVIFSAIGLALLYAQRAGLTRIYTAVADNGWAYLWASVLVATVAHDAYFYWTHRLLHWHPLFRLAHRVHHRSTNPTPWARMPSIR